MIAFNNHNDNSNNIGQIATYEINNNLQIALFF